MDKNILSELFDSAFILIFKNKIERVDLEGLKEFYLKHFNDKIKSIKKIKNGYIYIDFLEKVFDDIFEILSNRVDEGEIQDLISALIQRKLSNENEKKVTKVFTKKKVEEKKYQYYRKLKELIENSDYQSFEKLFKTEEIVYYYKEEYRYFPLEFNLTLELFNQLINARSNTNNASSTTKFEHLLKILWILLNNSYGSYLKTSIEHLKHLNQLYQSTLIPLNNRTNKEKFQFKSNQFQSELDDLIKNILKKDRVLNSNDIKRCRITIRKVIKICNLISNNKQFQEIILKTLNADDPFKDLFMRIQKKIENNINEEGKIRNYTYNKNNTERQIYINLLERSIPYLQKDPYVLLIQEEMTDTNNQNKIYHMICYKFFSYLLSLSISLFDEKKFDNNYIKILLNFILKLLLKNNDYIQDRYKYILKIDLIKKELRESVNTRIKLKKNNGTKVSMENNNSEYTEYKKIFETGTPKEKLDKINGIELKKELKSIHGYYLFSLDEEKYDYHSLHATFLKDWERVKEIYDFLSNERFTYNIEKTIENISTRNLLKRKPLRLSQNEQTEQFKNETTTSVIEEESAIQSPGNTGNLKFSEKNTQTANTESSQTLSETTMTDIINKLEMPRCRMIIKNCKNKFTNDNFIKELRNVERKPSIEKYRTFIKTLYEDGEKKNVMEELLEPNKKSFKRKIEQLSQPKQTTSVVEEQRAKGGNKIKYFKGPRNGVYYMKGKKKIYV